MKKQYYMGAGFAAVALSAVALFCAGPAKAVTTNLTVDAVLLEALTLTCGTPIDFANLYASPADEITITTGGVRSEDTGTDNLAPGGSPNAGVCSLNGTDNALVNVNIPDDTVVNGADVLEIDNYTVTGAAGVVTIDPNNFEVTLGVSAVPENISIGADLNIGAGDDPGTYTGTIVVTAAYD